MLQHTTLVEKKTSSANLENKELKTTGLGNPHPRTSMIQRKVHPSNCQKLSWHPPR